MTFASVQRIIRDRIAAEIAPQGGVLRCEVCGRAVPITQVHVADFLGGGWPWCCGYTMRWEAR